MAAYTYVGDAGREYPFLPEVARMPQVGETYTLDDDPADERWQLVTSKNPPKE